MATILVTGGAGYVGAHCCLALKRAGHDVVVYDDLSNGHSGFVKWGPLVEGDIRDKAALRSAFSAHKPDAVLHCAALIEVGASVKRPAPSVCLLVKSNMAIPSGPRNGPRASGRASNSKRSPRASRAPPWRRGRDPPARAFRRAARPAPTRDPPPASRAA